MGLPRLDGEAVRAQIAMLQREPFRELCAALLNCAPDEEALSAFARKSPDRWMQAIAIAGRLSGYTEKIEARETNLYMQINVLSDADLRRLHAQTLEQLRHMDGPVIIDALPEQQPDPIHGEHEDDA